MNWPVEVVLYVLLIASTIVALQTRDLLAASGAFGAFSFFIALLYFAMGAVDVGFTEAVVGTGAIAVLMIVALMRTTRRTSD